MKNINDNYSDNHSKTYNKNYSNKKTCISVAKAYYLRCWKMFTKFVVDFIPFKEPVQNMK